MPRIILLNGPPGIGKSTLATRYVQDHPFTFNLDIDRIRDLIGGWRTDRAKSGLLARSASLAIAQAHLSNGLDVVIAQFLRRADFLDQLDALVDEVGAQLLEVVLIDDKSSAVERFMSRPSSEALTKDEFEIMYDELLELLKQRPSSKIIRTTDGEIEVAYQGLLGVMHDAYQ